MTSQMHITPTGDLSIFEITAFKAQLQTALEQNRPIAIDLGEIEMLDASALQLVIAACRHESVQLINVPARVAQRFSQIGWMRMKGQD